MLCGTAGGLGFGHQCRVVFSGGGVFVGADDLGDGDVVVAISPVPDRVVRPHVGQFMGRIAPGVALIGPVLAIKVEVFGGPQIHRQRRDPGRRSRRAPAALRLRPTRRRRGRASAALLRRGSAESPHGSEQYGDGHQQ